jgi:hypothetical protein
MRRSFLLLALLALPGVARADGADPTNPVVLREYQLYGCASGPGAPEWCTTIKATILTGGWPDPAQQFTLTFLNPDCPGCGEINNEQGHFGLYDSVRLTGVDGCHNNAIDFSLPCDFAANEKATLTLDWYNSADPGPYRHWYGTYTTTPEPASLVLTATGMVGLVGSILRRRLH